MLERCGDRLNISRLDDNSIHAIAHNIARLARGDLRQPAGGCFICDFGATLPLRRQNANRALAEIIFRIVHKSHNANVIAPELLEIRLRSLVDVTDTSQLDAGQAPAMPSSEQA